jgi:hypothetical protein
MPQRVVSFAFLHSSRQYGVLIPDRWILLWWSDCWQYSWLSHGQSRSSCHVRSSAEVGNERQMVIHFLLQVGACLVVQSLRSYGAEKWRMSTGKEDLCLPSAMALVISGMLLHDAPELALSMHACTGCGARPGAPYWRGVNQASNASPLRLNLLKVAPSFYGSLNVAALSAARLSECRPPPAAQVAKPRTRHEFCGRCHREQVSFRSPTFCASA